MTLVADFTYSPNPAVGSAPLSVQFTDTSTGTVTAWLWDFRDGPGSTSTLQNPSYAFKRPGFHPVKLTVTGPDGSNTKELAVYGSPFVNTPA